MAKHISIKKTGSKIAYAGVFSEKHGRAGSGDIGVGIRKNTKYRTTTGEVACKKCLKKLAESESSERDYLAEYDTYINRREREHYDSLEYGCDDNSAPPDFNWEAIHDLIDWRSQTYFS